MSRPDILSRLAAGERLLLDGATGSELQRRGVNVSKGVTAEGHLGAWSATAMEDAPDIVRAVHADYLRAGADIVTTNSFWTNRPRLGMVGRAEKMEEYTRLSVEIARDARDAISPDAYVAGSMAAPLLPDVDLRKEFSDQGAVLAAAGVDLILLEYIVSTAEAVPMVEAAASTGLPVFLGICEITGEGTLASGETVEQLLAAFPRRRPDAILAMCCHLEAASAILPKLRKAFDGPIGAYAQAGYNKAPTAPNYPESQWHVIEIGENTPERYAKFAREWLRMGAQIIGSCCATTPEHTQAIGRVVKG